MNFTKKIIISSVIFVALIALLSVFAIAPLVREIKINSEAIVLEKDKYSALEAKIGNLDKFKDLYKEYSVNLEKINTLFINAEVPVEFIGFLEGIAEDNDIQLTISPSSARTTGGTWPFITFRIGCVGEYSDFMKFVEKIESAPYLLEIQNLDIRRIEPKEGEVYSGDISAGLTIKIYTK